MRLQNFLSRLMGRLKSGNAPVVIPATDDFPDVPNWIPNSTDVTEEIDEILARAASGATSSDSDWITVLDREFLNLPLLPAMALLHYINPNDARAKAVERLAEAPLDDYTKTLVIKWENDRYESTSLSLAMAVQYWGVRQEKDDYLALANSIRLMSLSNKSLVQPSSGDTARSIAACAAGVAQALVQDSRELFARTDLNREMLANLAFICLGWRSASANMTRFSGPERSFNHIAFGIGHDLSKSPLVFRAVGLTEKPAEALYERHASEPTQPIFDDSPSPDDIPACFDGPFEDPIIEDVPSGPENYDPHFSDPRPKSSEDDGGVDSEFYAREMPLPAERSQSTRTLRSTHKTGKTVPALTVCNMQPENLKDRRTLEIAASHRHVIGVAVPLIETPDLSTVRKLLIDEFPYAIDAIDLILNELVGRTTVKLEPLVLFGKSGAGKSRFARRLADILGIGIVRTDGARSDGNVFGGTDRRWHSAEPCHPFLAISRTRTANPMILIDEAEKTATRNDSGRLWDCLLAFLEPETSRCYPDPALQIEIDLSAISYVLTANDLDNLPHALRDRLSIIEFPEPSAEHLDALIKPVFADYLKSRGFDLAWSEPLTQMEHDALAERWKGGSVRKLNRLMKGVMRAREKALIRH